MGRYVRIGKTIPVAFKERFHVLAGKRVVKVAVERDIQPVKLVPPVSISYRDPVALKPVGALCVPTPIHVNAFRRATGIRIPHHSRRFTFNMADSLLVCGDQPVALALACGASRPVRATSRRARPGRADRTLIGRKRDNGGYLLVTYTSLNMNGLSLSLKALPLAVVTFFRMTFLVLTYGKSST